MPLLAVLAIHRYPGDTEAMWMVIAQILSVLIACGAALLWAIFYSGLRPFRVATIAVAFVALFMASIRVSCKGDMQPLFALRPWAADLFGVSNDDELEKHRAAQAGLAKPTDLPAIVSRPTDWPGYRGLNRDGLVRTSPELLADWRETPPKLIWKQPIGGGYGAFAVAFGRLYSLEQRRDRETVVCYVASSGQELWATGWDARFKDSKGGPGPRSTPTVFDGRVYAFGATGHLECLDAETGKEVWSVECLGDGENMQWGLCSSPLIVDGPDGKKLVVVQPGAQGGAKREGQEVMAFEAASGNKVWQSGSLPAGYASPFEATIAGVRQLLIFDSVGLAGLDPESGKEFWRVPWKTDFQVNSSQPIVLTDDTIFVASGYGKGGGTFTISRGADGKFKATQDKLTDRSSMRCKFSSPLAIGDSIYGLNDGIMECISTDDLETLWKDKRRAGVGEAYGHGQMLGFPDAKRIVVQTEDGELVWLAADPGLLKELGRIQALDGPKSWNSPAFSDGFLYARNASQMACYDLRK